MALEPRDLAVIPQYALAGIDHADGFALRLENRALLDMQFDEARKFLRANSALAAIADAVQCLGHGDAFGIPARQNIVGGEIADIGRRRHHGRRETRAFLVGPVDDADRHLGFDPGVIERANHLERRQRAEHAVELAAGRLGIEVRAEPDRGLRHVAALAKREHRTERIDMHVEPCGLARPAEPVADLLVLRAERQPPYPAFLRGAEFRGFVDGVPETGGIDLQIGCGLAHAAVPDTRGYGDGFSMTRQRRRVNQGTRLRDFAGEIGDEFDRDRIRGRQPAAENVSGEIFRSVGAFATARPPVRFRRSPWDHGNLQPSIAMGSRSRAKRCRAAGSAAARAD